MRTRDTRMASHDGPRLLKFRTHDATAIGNRVGGRQPVAQGTMFGSAMGSPARSLSSLMEVDKDSFATKVQVLVYCIALDVVVGVCARPASRLLALGARSRPRS